MTLTSNQIDELRRSWDTLASNADWLVETFYARLFAEAPHVSRYFNGLDMTEQRRKLAAALTLVIRHADSFDGLTPLLHELGDRHARRGIGPADYDAVGAALIGALATALGDAFTAETQDAWACAYGAVASEMMSGDAGLARKIA